MTPDTAFNVADALSPFKVNNCFAISGGGNNNIFRVECREQLFALKWYPSQKNDYRDRMGAEFSAFEFLATNGPSPCPRAYGFDLDADAALYEWIDGDTIRKPSLTEIGAAVDFVKHLHKLSNHPEAVSKFNLASEACLSLNELTQQIESRLERIGREADKHTALNVFLSENLLPQFEHAVDTARSGYIMAQINDAEDISQQQRTLSPSDFGFHNAIRKFNGEIIFIDFEYFGWDDPVKLVADFLIHPAMALEEEQQNYFWREANKIFSDDPLFGTRFQLQFPLYICRWCLILLNEFLPERLQSRRRAGMDDEIQVIHKRQLGKAQNMFDRLNKNTHAFC